MRSSGSFRPTGQGYGDRRRERGPPPDGGRPHGRCRSRIGGGTVRTVRLQLTSRGPPLKIRVLIADDEPQLRSALADLIASEDGLTLVGAAADADEAIRLATVNRPEVAIVDVAMPGGGGPRAAREILRSSPGTKVIALSAHEDRATVLEMLRAGAVGYLVKGTAPDEILRSIAQVVAGQASLSAEVMGGVVHELSTQLRREESASAERRVREERIARFAFGEGLRIDYQPIVDLRTREQVGVEALSRFESDPVRAPDAWFKEAVEVGLGIELELAAVRRAVAGLSRLPEPMYLSMNASHRLATNAWFLEELEDIPAKRLVVEITEHEPVDDYDELSKALDTLRARGIRIAIDDAGAGFSSLRHTLRIAPDILKIDMSITHDIDKDRGRRALASALASFAEEMGMAVIAEGVEEGAELATLLELGVRFGQGYLFGHPAALASTA